jgi:MFS family permease
MTQTYLPIPSATVRWNLRQLYWDILWFGVLAGTTLAFLSIFVARLGASSFQVGLLSAGPALVNLAFTLPAGQWLEGKPLIRAAFLSSIGQRAGYVVLIAMPMLFVSQQGQIWAIIGLILVMSVAGTLLAIAFNALYAEVVPVEWRGKVAGWRNALVAVSVTLTTLLSGYILDKVLFPLNYQIIFLIGACGALLSSFHLGRVRHTNETESQTGISGVVIPASITRAHWWDWLLQIGRRRTVSRSIRKPLLRLDLVISPFGLFMAGCLVFYTFQYFGVPIFPMFYVNELHLTDGEIGLGGAMFHGTMMVGSLFLNRLSVTLGHRKLMLLGVFLFAQFPLLLGMASDAGLYYLACLMGGFIFAFLNGGLVNRLMERVPTADRPAHMALHNLALNMGILAGSMLGPLFGEWIGLREALYLTAGLRLLAAVVLWKWG